MTDPLKAAEGSFTHDLKHNKDIGHGVERNILLFSLSLFINSVEHCAFEEKKHFLI